MKYVYYPGCSLGGTAREYGISARAVNDALGLEFQELADWSCCGASSAHMTNLDLALALPARNLALAEAQGARELVTACASCYQRLAIVAHEVNTHPRARERANQLTGADYKGGVTPRHLLDVLGKDVGVDRVAARVTRPLEGLKVACYYGCLLVRPVKATGFDDPEDPQTMDTLVKAAGAQVVTWPFKTECCGASFSMSRTDVVVGMAAAVLSEAKAAGADCLVTACPMCHSNLDMRQSMAARVARTTFNLPIYYITQLLGLSFGYMPRQLGLNSHFVKALPLLRRLRLV